MNSVCTGLLFNQLIFHMVSEDNGYTFDQDIKLEAAPVMQFPHTVSASSSTKCIIGPNHRLIYGGDKITQKFVYTKEDVIRLGYKLIEKVERDA
jgi:hypothetical protein